MLWAGMQACKAADDLKANLEEEYVAVREFIVEFCRHMDFVQHAKMLVSGCELLPILLHLSIHCQTACHIRQFPTKLSSLVVVLASCAPSATQMWKGERRGLHRFLLLGSALHL